MEHPLIVFTVPSWGQCPSTLGWGFCCLQWKTHYLSSQCLYHPIPVTPELLWNTCKEAGCSYQGTSEISEAHPPFSFQAGDHFLSLGDKRQTSLLQAPSLQILSGLPLVGHSVSFTVHFRIFKQAASLCHNVWFLLGMSCMSWTSWDFHSDSKCRSKCTQQKLAQGHWERAQHSTLALMYWFPDPFKMVECLISLLFSVKCPLLTLLC